MTLNRDPQRGQSRFIALPDSIFNQRQYLPGKLQQYLSLGCKLQRLCFADKNPEAQAVLQLTELMRKGGLCLMQRICRTRQ
ncbi:hypothetical protein AYY18_17390 [Morganella psychrotolerans]|uniref:Uncharacterized protein n=1 Tax=Morganella psychrotolerans TaxID=368603 RepID=A0A1B8HRQ0_9GAMM|nr:hypothetical protein AYY18_17390 [Morganella psychrotolerans]